MILKSFYLLDTKLKGLVYFYQNDSNFRDDQTYLPIRAVIEKIKFRKTILRSIQN